jgi:hypothetical protein
VNTCLLHRDGVRVVVLKGVGIVLKRTTRGATGVRKYLSAPGKAGQYSLELRVAGRVRESFAGAAETSSRDRVGTHTAPLLHGRGRVWRQYFIICPDGPIGHLRLQHACTFCLNLEDGSAALLLKNLGDVLPLQCDTVSRTAWPEAVGWKGAPPGTMHGKGVRSAPPVRPSAIWALPGSRAGCVGSRGTRAARAALHECRRQLYFDHI